MEHTLPVRKHTRLKDYDYRLPGYYHVVVHAASDAPLFSIVHPWRDSARLQLTPCGAILARQLQQLPQRFPQMRVDRSVIMPNHIHAIIQICGPSDQSLTDILGAFKSLATRECNKVFSSPGTALFQTSFYENVIRDEADYVDTCRYLDENPMKWLMSRERVP